MKPDLSDSRIREKQQDSLVFSKALAFAAEKHAGQIRKNGTPYILHPISVAQMLASDGFDLRYQIAALFHDLLEDTDATPEELSAFCDESMLEAIHLVTKKRGYDAEAYIRAILVCPMAKAIKNADRIQNLTELASSGDLRAKENYIRDTEKHYVGRFSPELDAAHRRLVDSCKDAGTAL